MYIISREKKIICLHGSFDILSTLLWPCKTNFILCSLSVIFIETVTGKISKSFKYSATYWLCHDSFNPGKIISRMDKQLCIFPTNTSFYIYPKFFFKSRLENQYLLWILHKQIHFGCTLPSLQE